MTPTDIYFWKYQPDRYLCVETCVSEVKCSILGGVGTKLLFHMVDVSDVDSVEHFRRNCIEESDLT